MNVPLLSAPPHVFTVSLEWLSNVLCAHLASISSGAQANLFLAYNTHRAFTLPGNHQGNKESSVHTIKLISVDSS